MVSYKALNTILKLPCHELKGLLIIVTTLLGIVMLVRESHPSKAQSPIVVTLFGIFMLVRERHPEYLLLVDYQYYTL